MEEVYLKDSAAVCRFIYWLKKNVGKMKITEVTAADYLDHLRSEIDGIWICPSPPSQATKKMRP